jgi:hypothetical protein
MLKSGCSLKSLEMSLLYKSSLVDLLAYTAFTILVSLPQNPTLSHFTVTLGNLESESTVSNVKDSNS